ncbi:MAG: bifunctional pyr operon transcriptional regulator/uracil phosphoribosyltransferase PyrR [Nitrosomonas sp.]|nr:MAG: bifunctional pyr operon transcriptional regulator/uracil phosphoribosyltransferase PyrR [Nitrosomonas sp.]
MQLPDAEAAYKNLIAKIQADRCEGFILVGIRTGGAWLAKRLHRESANTNPLGLLSTSFHRDDFDKIGLHAQMKPSEIPFDVNGAHILLIDDVLHTGRTVRAAINELFDYGRPASINLAVLADRCGRELPIAAQYSGTVFELPSDQMLELKQNEHGKFIFRLYAKGVPE